LTGDDRLGDRGDRQETRDERQQGRQDTRGERQQGRQDTRGERQQNREDIRNDWQENRDEIRNDWQEHRDQARDDWQGWFDDHYGMYGGWYGGYASGYWGRWDYLWDNYPVAAAAGLTWWGANALGYAFGYSDYYNPYYTESMPAYYSEPIITVPVEPVQTVTVEQGAPAAAAQAAPAAPAAPAPSPSVNSEAVAKFDQARAAFLENNYNEALKLTDAAVAQMPRDAVLHEFRSLVLFALGRYPESAATIHAVLDVGPGWDWKTLSGLYSSIDVYKSQLRALETASDEDPKSAALQFLLGYHYLTCGHEENALKAFRRTAELQPQDLVAASLLATLSPRDAQPAKTPAAPTPKDVPSDSIVGNWTATGKGESKYSMSLNKDGSFSWGFTHGRRKEEVKGVHTLEGNVLAMEPDSGGVMLAELSVKGPDTLQFKMIGGKSDDPGLEFQREATKKGK
jgi:tetratricopeptide (TPR) repeat protein